MRVHAGSAAASFRAIGLQPGRGLGPRLVALVALVTLLTGGTIGLLTLESARASWRAEILDSRLAAADITAGLAAQYVAEAERGARQLAGHPTILQAALDDTPARAASVLAAFAQEYPQFDDVGLVDLDGILRASAQPADPALGTNLAEQGFVAAVLATGQPYLGLPARAWGTGQPVVNYAVPMRDATGAVRAVLVAPISLASLTATITAVRAGASSRATLLDVRGNGRILAHVDPTRLMQPPSGRNEATARLLAGERGALEVRNSVGELDLAAFTPVPGVPWGVLILDPSDAVFAPVVEMTRRVLLLIGLALLLAVVLGVWMARRITRPLAELRAAAARLGAGDVGVRLASVGDDELGQVARTFNAMADAIAEKDAQLHDQAAQLEHQVRARTAELEASQARLRLAIEATGLGTWTLDPATKMVEWSPRCAALFGMPGDLHVPFDQAMARVHPDHRASVFEVIQASLQPGSSGQYETEFRTMPQADGADRWLLARGRVLYDAGRPVRLTGTVLDITERKQLEVERAQRLAHEEVARAKDEVVSVVSHELRTPLASVVGFAELLLARDFPEAQRREFLTIMLEEGRRLTALINDFLDLQRMESGRQPIRPRPTNLRALLDRAVASAGEDPARPIQVAVADDLPPVLADPDRIQQVVLNLLSNARKYSPRGGPVHLAARSTADGLVEITVRDQGLGLPPEALPRLFVKFYRVDNSDRREIKGTGLGLAIVKNIVEAHGGRVWATSPGVGQGSTFGFTLPAGLAQAPERAPSGAETPGAQPPGGDVLVVEDDARFAAWLGETLRAEGYSLRVAPSVEAAVRAVEQARPSVVLLDVRLSGQLDGWDLLAVLRGRPDTHNLPVVVVSVIQDPDRAQALGVQDYLVKPVGRDRLLATLHRLGMSPSREVLVVEDSPQAQELVLQYLRTAGLAARAVASGEEALAALAAQPDAYGAMVLDLGLPGIDGLTVLEAIRTRPAVQHLPVVILTGRDLSPMDKQYLSQRACEVVRKGNGVPITEAVARALEQMRA